MPSRSSAREPGPHVSMAALSIIPPTIVEAAADGRCPGHARRAAHGKSGCALTDTYSRAHRRTMPIRQVIPAEAARELASEPSAVYLDVRTPEKSDAGHHPRGRTQ